MRKSVRFWILLIVPIVIMLAFLGLTMSSRPIIATSPYTIQQITEVMNSTNHMRLVNYLGQTPDGKTIFTYRWTDYGVLTALRASSEDSQIEKALSINRVD